MGQNTGKNEFWYYVIAAVVTITIYKIITFLFF